ncbi:MAG: hypothetical protein HZB51_13890 [Chloroflexi bacterium]|nr:hypothetical protein [Chloroflexota bacterium]
MITIQLDGQSFQIPDLVAAKDELLKAALAPFVPWIANAQIDRQEKDGATVVSLIKRADWKGTASVIVNALIASPNEMNPAVALWIEMQGQLDTNDPGTILALEPSITAALEAGDQDIAAVHQSLMRLVECAPVPARRIPLGF